MITYIPVLLADVASVQARLDSIVAGQPGTEHYSLPQYSVNPAGLDYVIFQVDERAEDVLTIDEWASRLATMPIEFVRPLPE